LPCSGLAEYGRSSSLLRTGFSLLLCSSYRGKVTLQSEPAWPNGGFLIAPLTPGQDNCRPVLELTGRNFSVDQSTLAVQMNIYNQYCQSDTTKSGSDFNAGVQYLGSLGLSFGGSNNQEIMQNFCKTFSSNYSQNKTTFDSASTVATASVKAWLACEQAKNNGVLFQPTLQKTQFSLGVKRTGAHVGNVTRISYDTKLLSCKVDGQLPKTLTEDFWNISCTRTPQTDAKTGDTEYPEADFLVETTLAPPFPLTLPADGTVHCQFASEIQKQLDQFNGLLSVQQNRQYKIVFDIDNAMALYNGTPNSPLSTDTNATPAADQANGFFTWKRNLGEHDVCVLNGMTDQLGILGVSTTCIVEPDGSNWILTAQAGRTNAVICHYRCGRIQ
jgi:hypothetical protein